MNPRTITLGLGTALSTFLLAGATTIELLGAGEAPGIGILGVLVGFIAGLLAGGVVSVSADRISGIAALGLVAYATFGVAFVTIAGIRYVNVPFADDVFTFAVQISVSVALAVLVALLMASKGSGKLTESA
ncbi:permease [Haloarcula halophila]|uniref:permease n=1 Tax=Haloarcula TaxID=2237 RepID=UPI0023E4290C|nr:permease [Halomicroarcula sp. DFY41]